MFQILIIIHLFISVEIKKKKKIMHFILLA